jgi:ubiquinone/menaquinone biosynthesis C-methylase UbiE
VKAEGGYDSTRAAAYWSTARHEGAADELASVLSLGEPSAVNQAYDAWESGLLSETASLARGQAGLDLGAGVGRIAVRLAPILGRVACGDLAPGMLARLRRNAAAAGAKNIDPVRLRSDGLPFRSKAFTFLACVGLLEHLPPSSQDGTLSEAARVLRSGGRLALILNNGESRFLADPKDNPYRDGLQRESGYYCSVVSEKRLLEQSAAHFDSVPAGSNLFYSLQRHAARSLPDSKRRDPRLKPFFDAAAAWDLALRPLGPMARAAADHHLYVLARR